MKTAELLIELARPGDRVSALFPAGGGEYKRKTGKVAIARARYGTLVLNLGGRFGTPGCVTAKNIVALHISDAALEARLAARPDLAVAA